MLIITKNVTTSNGNEDILLKDKDLKELCLIDEDKEVGDP